MSKYAIWRLGVSQGNVYAQKDPTLKRDRVYMSKSNILIRYGNWDRLEGTHVKRCVLI
ncbi:hypothetical protein D3C87_713570 [compost metagenome]